MSYKLSETDNNEPEIDKEINQNSLKQLLGLMKNEKKSLAIAMVAIIINSLTFLGGPYVLGLAVDNFINNKDLNQLVHYVLMLLGVYIVMFITDYLNIREMGRIGQRVLFALTNDLFSKIQSLPLAFFNQNQAGDLISRLNNDSRKLSEFFSETLVRFVGTVVSLGAVAAFMVVLNWQLGLITLLPAVGLFIFTRIVIPVMKRVSKANLKALGNLSAEVQQSIDNFKVIVAFNRRDYFSEKFSEANNKNFNAALKAGIVNNSISPIYDLASTIALLIVITVGITLISNGQLSLGILIAYIAYVDQFYKPLRTLSYIWTSLQTSLAAFERISEILKLKSNLKIEEDSTKEKGNHLIELKDVSFTYEESGKTVLKENSLKLDEGKTYAFVGPTGGGKTTTASLIARLFDATEGEVILKGKNIKSYSDEERTQMIGFIVQDPFLFTGTLKENLIYGNSEYSKIENEKLLEELNSMGLEKIISRFEKRLDTEISTASDNISLGQKQVIAFIRAVLRKPALLILDEATANLDTVTEQLLDQIIEKLPKETTKVIIAHRLNTISNADEIFFVNGGKIEAAGSLKHAIEMLSSQQKNS